MIKTGLRIKKKRILIKACVIVYICSFFMGGLISFAAQYTREGIIFFASVLVSYFLSLKTWEYIRALVKNQEKECDVLLCNGDESVKVKALLDTGNCLKDPVTGKAVSIIGKETWEVLWKQKNVHNIRYISYHTIGKKEGIMPLFVIERMCLCMEEEQWIEKPLIAVSNEAFGNGIYKMILNPEV